MTRTFGREKSVQVFVEHGLWASTKQKKVIEYLFDSTKEEFFNVKNLHINTCKPGSRIKKQTSYVRVGGLAGWSMSMSS